MIARQIQLSRPMSKHGGLELDGARFADHVTNDQETRVDVQTRHGVPALMVVEATAW